MATFFNEYFGVTADQVDEYRPQTPKEGLDQQSAL
jgi:hypothetical protein